MGIELFWVRGAGGLKTVNDHILRQSRSGACSKGRLPTSRAALPRQLPARTNVQNFVDRGGGTAFGNQAMVN